jgi:hypothetical protein
MAKGRDKQGREQKKKKKAKQPAVVGNPNMPFRHHSVVTGEPETPVRTTE